MASIYRPSYTRTDPKTGRKVKKKLRKYYVEYKNAEGRVVRVPGFSDKKATEALAVDLERQAARGQVGLLDPFAEHAKRPLLEHLHDYRRALDAKEDDPKHVAQTIRYIEMLAEGAGITRINDLEPDRVMSWINQERKAGIGARTANYHMTAVKGFTRWLVRGRRLPYEPLAPLQKLNQETDKRHPRRAVSDEEMERVLIAARDGKPFRKLPGRDRFFLYLVATYTGYRKRELTGILPESFQLDADPPTLTVEAGRSKRKRTDVVPIHPEVVAMLRPYLAEKPRGKPVWPGGWHARAAEMLRRDLEVAGIPYQDEAGLFFDFHATRGQFGTTLARRGVHPRTAQKLMRHSDINLTMNLYSHLELRDLQAGVAELPSPMAHEGRTGGACGKREGKAGAVKPAQAPQGTKKRTEKGRAKGPGKGKSKGN